MIHTGALPILQRLARTPIRPVAVFTVLLLSPGTSLGAGTGRDALPFEPGTELEPATLEPALASPAPSVALRGPIDENEYIVGPGDLFAITIQTRPGDAIVVSIGPEGELVLPGIASVPLAGELLSGAKRKIRDAVASQYRNAEVSVSLTGLRRIEVNVVGNVSRPGTYTGTALDEASRMIPRRGGTPGGPRPVSTAR